MNHLSMNHFSRLYALTVVVAAIVVVPLLCATDSTAQLTHFLHGSPSYLLHGSQGYLGVTLADVDNDRANALKLKDAKGAEVVTVDHDAPAGKAGLQVHDVILQMNGQTVEGAEQLRRMLHETPAGRAVNFVVSRDGQPMNLAAQLVDRRDLDREIWGKHINRPEPEQEPPMTSFLNDKTIGNLGSGDIWSRGSGGSFSVGAVVDPLTAQLASYFGATEGMGLLVKSVDGKSPAAAAGLKAGDIVLKINEDAMGTRADWERVLRANQGKQVQLTVLREKKQQQLSMQAGSLKKKGALELPEFSSGDSRQMVAELRESLLGRESLLDMDSNAIADEAQDAVKSIDPEALRQQVEQVVNQIDLDALRKELRETTRYANSDLFREDLQAAQEATRNIDVAAIRIQAAKQVEMMKKQIEEMQQHCNEIPPQ